MTDKGNTGVPPLNYGSANYSSIEVNKFKINSLEFTDLIINGTIQANEFTDGVAVWKNGIISNMNNPVDPQDGTNKFYVDNAPNIVPSGPLNSVQYNSFGSFGGDSVFTWDNNNTKLNIGGTIIVDNLKSEILSFVSDNDNTTSLTLKRTDGTIGDITDYTIILPPNSGTSNYVLATNGSGNLTWIPNGLATGSLGQLQYADGSGGFSASSDLVFTEGSCLLTVNGTTSSTIVSTDTLNISTFFSITDTGTTGYSTTFQAPDTLATSYTITLPPDDGNGSTKVLTTDGGFPNATLSWTTTTAVPGGSHGSVQFNSGGTLFGGSTDFTFNNDNPSDSVMTIKNTVTQINENDPLLVGTYTTGTRADNIMVMGDYSYIVDSVGGLFSILNVSRPSSISLEGSLSVVGALDVYVSGLFAYMISTSGTVSVIDISNKSSPTLTGTVSLTGTSTISKIQVVGHIAYTVTDTRFSIIDISNSESPIVISEFAVSNILDFVVIGKFTYCITATNMIILNVLDPTSVSTKSNSVLFTAATAIYIVEPYAYVTGSIDGIVIVDISDPSTPSVSSFLAGGSYNGIFVSGKYAYVTNSTSGELVVIDISSPVLSGPSIKGSLTGITDILSVYVEGLYIYVTKISVDPMSIIDCQGASILSSSIGSVETNNLTVYNDVHTISPIFIKNGLNVSGSLYTNGVTIIKNEEASIADYGTVSNFDTSAGTIVVTGPTSLFPQTTGVITVTNNRVSSNSIIMVSINEFGSDFPMATSKLSWNWDIRYYNYKCSN